MYNEYRIKQRSYNTSVMGYCPAHCRSNGSIKYENLVAFLGWCHSAFTKRIPAINRNSRKLPLLYDYLETKQLHSASLTADKTFVTSVYTSRMYGRNNAQYRNMNSCTFKSSFTRDDSESLIQYQRHLKLTLIHDIKTGIRPITPLSSLKNSTANTNRNI
jgi:hypothetical protein